MENISSSSFPWDTFWLYVVHHIENTYAFLTVANETVVELLQPYAAEA